MMPFKYTFLALAVPGIFLTDQITKLAVIIWIPLGERRAVIDGFFDLVHFQNTGAAFGFLSGSAASFRIPFFYIIALIATCLLALYFRLMGGGERRVPVAISLVFGGMAGNVIDRIRLGAVTDFLSFHIGERVLSFSLFGIQCHWVLEWPAFNVADSAITIAMFLLVISVFRPHHGRRS